MSKLHHVVAQRRTRRRTILQFPAKQQFAPIRLRNVVVVVVLFVAGCAGGNGAAVGGMSLKVASFDLVAAKQQRFNIGLVDNTDQLVLVGGSVDLSFRQLAAEGQAARQDSASFNAAARFVPLAGQPEISANEKPSFTPGTAGVYRTEPISFPAAGFWQVDVRARTSHGLRRATASFEVAVSSLLPRPGDRAPNTRNPLPSARDVSMRAIDSRAADEDPTVPDPELHAVSVADALAANRPVIVVVSTPTFCESRFCGPITDSVAILARTTGNKVAFVHLEVWRNFEANELNPAAQEWIDPSGTHEGNEPWVFVVDRNGMIVERFDNVASDADLRAAVNRIAD